MRNIWNRCPTRHRHTTAHWTRHFPPPLLLHHHHYHLLLLHHLLRRPLLSLLFLHCFLYPRRLVSFPFAFVELPRVAAPLSPMWRLRRKNGTREVYTPAVIHSVKKKTNTAAFFCRRTYDYRWTRTVPSEKLPTGPAHARIFIYALCGFDALWITVSK